VPVNVSCTLTFLSDDKARYTDDLNQRRPVEGAVGGDALTRRTINVLSHWVATYDVCKRDELTLLGLHLYELAFGPSPDAPLRTAFESTYETFLTLCKRSGEAAGHRLRVRLVFNNEVKDLTRLPWEFMHMPWREGGFFLAGENTDLILTRFVPKTRTGDNGAGTNDPATAHGAEPLRILVVVSRPRELDTPKVDQLLEDLNLHTLQAGNTIAVQTLERPTSDTFTAVLKESKPHIVHFIGHGEQGKLALVKTQQELADAERENRNRVAKGESPIEVTEAAWLDAGSVKSIFSGHKPGILFLHACDGAAPTILLRSLESFRSTAQELAYAGGIPAVVAMQYAITNPDAETFARSFYQSIRQGRTVDEAVSEARRTLGGVGAYGRQAWDSRAFGTPVVYLRGEVGEKPIIWPPPTRADDDDRPPPEQVRVLEWVQCPYERCPGSARLGRNVCTTCRRAVAVCPVCGGDTVYPVETGFCDRCAQQVRPVGATVATAPGGALERGGPQPALSTAPRSADVFSSDPRDGVSSYAARGSA
jgi:hypothetical protein